MQKASLPVLALTGFIFTSSAFSRAEIFQEDFSADPVSQGWKTFGDPTLFHWNSVEQNLEVTWNSSQSNSYFHRPLGTILAKADDFQLAFDLRLLDVAVGATPGKPYTFQIAVGFLNFADATRTNFLRGTGIDSPNVVEFDYFPDSGFGATISPTIISRSNQFATSFNFPNELGTGALYHIEMTYTASNRTLATVITSNGFSTAPIADVVPAEGFDDFCVDNLAISSYSDAGQDPMFAGSIRARGIVDNFAVTTPAPPIRNLRGRVVNGRWETEFLTRPGWLYTLERTEDFQTWNAASTTTAGDGEVLIFQNDAPAPGTARFYRIRADRP